MAAPRIQLIISESNVSIPNNTSVLTGTLYYYGNGETWNQNTACSITINGSTTNFTVAIGKNTSGIIGRHSVTVEHDADGNKTVSYSAVVDASAYYGATTTSGSYVCTWIKRATQPSLSPAVVKYGESTTINLPRADSGFVHDLYYSVGNGWVRFKSSAGASYTWTVPKTLATSGTENPTKTIVIRAITYSGGSSVGEKTVNLSVNPADDMVPGLSIKIEDPTGNYTKFGAYVKSQSKIKCNLTETLSYDSPIKSRSIEIDGVKYTQNPAESRVIAYPDKSVTATITDGRGMSTTKSVKPTVIDWWPPNVTRFSVARCDSAGALQADGAYIRVDYAVKIAPLNDKNTKSAVVRYKKQSDTSWEKSVTAAVDGYTYQGYVVLEASTEYSYDIELSVSDYFTTTPIPGVIGTAFTLMDWHASGTGMAIGKVAEQEDAFEIALNTQVGRNLDVDGNSTFLTSYGGGTTAPTSAPGGITTLTEVGGGRKYISSANGTGFLKVVLPQDFIRTLIKFDVEIYSYSRQAICTYSIGGQIYKNSDGVKSWSYRVVNVQGVGGSNLTNLNVTFGVHNGKAAIAIGAADTAWDYCMIVIRNVEASLYKFGVDKWRDGWEIIIDANPLDEVLQTNTKPQSRVLSGMGIADYVVEQGTTNAWSWEKYANGKIHCERKVSTGYTATSASGNLYYTDYDIVVPDAIPVLTDTISNVIIMPQAGNGLSFFMPKSISGRTIGYRYVNSASVINNQLTVLYQFDGKWK